MAVHPGWFTKGCHGESAANSANSGAFGAETYGLAPCDCTEASHR